MDRIMILQTKFRDSDVFPKYTMHINDGIRVTGHTGKFLPNYFFYYVSFVCNRFFVMFLNRKAVARSEALTRSVHDYQLD